MRPSASNNVKPKQTVWLNFVVFTTLTIFALLQGQISVFYIVYLFWWEELLRIIVNAIYNKTYRKDDLTTQTQLQAPLQKEFLTGTLFMMSIYLVFLIVFFGLMANWGNRELLIINVRVMLFGNWFFNLNLIFTLVNQINYRRGITQVVPDNGAFTPNMIILHISIIVGAILHFFVANKFPNIFTQENLWGSVLMTLPFFLLRFFIQRKA